VGEIDRLDDIATVSTEDRGDAGADAGTEHQGRRRYEGGRQAATGHESLVPHVLLHAMGLTVRRGVSGATVRHEGENRNAPAAQPSNALPQEVRRREEGRCGTCRAASGAMRLK
jgi:hypothetical protein